jgi:hypothetical protein
MKPVSPLELDLLTPYAPAETDDPRRLEPRVRTFLGGKLIFGAHDLTADCTVRNLTARGAKVQTVMASTLSRELWLVVVKQGVAYRATVAWRRDDEVGLKFTSKHDLSKDDDPDLKIARYVWRQLTER